ncbi:MAG TPA: ATP-dependent DNA helicase RecG [Thermoanaerobaculia bacterium]|nr:ATP-dependent DNA helicase RecG [Thermoanaerobaculia bacterium]
MDLDTPLGQVRGVGPARARAFAAAGSTTVGDLLLHQLPFRYEDRRAVTPVTSASAGVAATFLGRLIDLRRIRTRRRGRRTFSLVRGFVEDATGRLPVVWFNRPYLAEQAKTDEEHLLHGPVREAKGGGFELLNPSCERAAGAVHSARIVPVYPAVKGVGPAFLRRLMDSLLAEVDLRQMPETLPADLLERHGLPALGVALEALHRPLQEDVEALSSRRTPAHHRLVYGELLEMQVTLALRREREAREPRSRRYRLGSAALRQVRQSLPFELTAAQEKVLGEIAADLGAPHPMHRLLQGDVGSGKTAVAALALALALESGFQGAFMAPTELLAEQHYESLARLLGGRYRIALLTGGTVDAGLKARIASGEAQLVVGTHALIQEGVELRDLGLAVIDEQHRFGVAQRELLRRKGARPDVLVMTATPIPRSLALTAWGDLPVSTLDEMPPGRTPVSTEVVPVRGRPRVYRRVREAIAAGARAYVVAPLIDESDRTGAVSLAEVEERVREALAGFPVAVLHGRLPAAERERTMRAFAAGEVRALVATTVIEVGVDVPEATWMVIESAERFGLAQLHQLRGRVGRGSEASVCVAIHGRLTEAGRERLAVFASTQDGFEIAERDLLLRGPGDVLGTRQSGLAPLRMARLPENWDWLVKARDDARELLERLDEPARQALADQVLEKGTPCASS